MKPIWSVVFFVTVVGVWYLLGPAREAGAFFGEEEPPPKRPVHARYLGIPEYGVGSFRDTAEGYEVVCYTLIEKRNFTGNSHGSAMAGGISCVRVK